MWAVLLRPVLGPVLMFVLFGIALAGGWAVWRFMPRGKVRDGLLLKLDGNTAMTAMVFALVAIAVGCAIYSS